MTLKDRVAVVTGASQGIGEAISVELAREQAQVVLVDIQKEKLDNVAGRIESAGGAASSFCVDVSNLDQVQEVELKVRGMT